MTVSDKENGCGNYWNDFYKYNYEFDSHYDRINSVSKMIIITTLCMTNCFLKVVENLIYFMKKNIIIKVGIKLNKFYKFYERTKL